MISYIIYCKNISANTIPVNMPTKSANSPTDRACFHLVIPTEEKYSDKT